MSAQQSDEEPLYLAVVRKNGSAKIHRSWCEHAKRAKAPLAWEPSGAQAGDEPCTRCLSGGIEAAESARLLEPWAKAHAAFLFNLDNHCRTLSDDELSALGRATYWPNQTNCWWADYEVVKPVRSAVRREQAMRVRRREREAEDHVTPPAAGEQS